ncbi:hypothetical protein Acr_21g0006500 [Actinidia rufa]|uniref:Uncharacterized protein n=1 Tax=Actinidia rufa TaxID=165716 RepID=A0A7J0GH51_9ERIC|nr:hypothetical protein Acr_21g0006500 [Actinidia rufa]
MSDEVTVDDLENSLPSWISDHLEERSLIGDIPTTSRDERRNSSSFREMTKSSPMDCLGSLEFRGQFYSIKDITQSKAFLKSFALDSDTWRPAEETTPRRKILAAQLTSQPTSEGDNPEVTIPEMTQWTMSTKIDLKKLARLAKAKAKGDPKKDMPPARGKGIHIGEKSKRAREDPTVTSAQATTQDIPAFAALGEGTSANPGVVLGLEAFAIDNPAVEEKLLQGVVLPADKKTKKFKEEYGVAMEKHEKEMAEMRRRELIAKKLVVDEFKASKEYKEAAEGAASSYFGEALTNCSSRRYGAPAPNRVGNGVRTRPHAPFEDRRVRSVSATRPGRSHALPRARGRTHAPARAKERLPRVSTRQPRAEEEGHIKRDCPKYKARDQSSDTAVTAVMAVDESEVLLAASDDGKSDWMQKDAVLRLVEEFSEFPRETRRCCGERRLEGYTDWRGMSRQGELLFDMGPVVLERRMDKGSNRCTEVRKASAGVLGGSVMVPGGSGVGTRAQGDALGYVRKSGQTRVMQPVQDVHREAQRKETKSILRSCTAKGAATPKRVSFALDLISGGVLSSWHLGEKVQGTSVWRCIHFGGKWSSPLMRLGISDAVLQSYGGAGSKVVRKDNLKTSDYPPVGWRGRLLSPAHLDESKPTWMSPSPVAKPKPDWSSCGVSM